jgi:hypothetical protein
MGGGLGMFTMTYQAQSFVWNEPKRPESERKNIGEI